MSPRELRATPAILHILLSLVEGPRHGYAILTELEDRSRGQLRLGPSTLYYTLGRLSDAGLIQENRGHIGEDEGEPHEAQRRYFAITAQGKDRLQAELSLFSDLMEHARALGLRTEG